jgi:hypothetical protein
MTPSFINEICLYFSNGSTFYEGRVRRLQTFLKQTSPKKVVDIDFVFLYFDRAKTGIVTESFAKNSGKTILGKTIR